MREFDWIARYFAPLTEGHDHALNLTDDAAVLPGNDSDDLVVTVDAMMAGRHFLPTDPPDLIARKLVRVNLSDLAAMGATPAYGFLMTAWPDDIQEEWIAAFAKGLALDQKEFGFSISGGDTVATPGPMTLSLTVIGTVSKGKALLRSGAKAGDIVYVSGVIGDGGLGLRLLQGETLDLTSIQAEGPKARYQLPEPRVALGQALRGIASAAMDISDGLVQDAEHMARASGRKIAIDMEKVPISSSAKILLVSGAVTRETLITAGDDYELFFTAAPEQKPLVEAASHASGVGVSAIGVVQDTELPCVDVLDAEGRTLEVVQSGYQHF